VAVGVGVAVGAGVAAACRAAAVSPADSLPADSGEWCAGASVSGGLVRRTARPDNSCEGASTVRLVAEMANAGPLGIEVTAVCERVEGSSGWGRPIDRRSGRTVSPCDKEREPIDIVGGMPI
jgi:hypothetical protein